MKKIESYTISLAENGFLMREQYTYPTKQEDYEYEDRKMNTFVFPDLDQVVIWMQDNGFVDARLNKENE